MCLDVQRTLFETRGRYLEALATYHKAVADLERLSGEELHTVPEDATPPKREGTAMKSKTMRLLAAVLVRQSRSRRMGGVVSGYPWCFCAEEGTRHASTR